ncbi:acyl-CoA synthetase [Denitromonas ohlonensis]|uniref:AMP-binding protein n=2 Tax=Denitromonas TaxID=139331 RepID=A0A557S671_9RHOO|nr:AMP-binding protein [Denitromonas ohlonensis]TVO68724.1 AMP-binding protein [Denitromonas ohlonensis]TVO72910.1 AMP-binding protein [Denitromonas ohlonensis]
MVPDTYAERYAAHRWKIPHVFNIADACCRRWADAPERIAILSEDADGAQASYSYIDLMRAANRLSNVLRARGIQAGDRVAIVMPQRFEAAVSLMALFQLGAVAMPLSTLFGPEAMAYRLQDSHSVAAIVDARGVDTLSAVRAECPALTTLICVDCAAEDALDWTALLAAASDEFPCEITAPDDPAVLIYTSGTTGAPKGALVPHRAMLGNLPGFVASQNGFPQVDAVFWSPADWAWTGGLWDALLPTLYFGQPIVAYSGRFSPETAFSLMARYRVTHTFLFPTALKAMMKAFPAPRTEFDLHLRAIMSAGEAVGDAVFDWCQSALGVTVNEMFGQTEINYIVGNSATEWPARPGSMGRAYPGHRVAVIDDAGQVLPPGEEGEVAVHRQDIHGDPDPVFFLGYWKNPEATERKYVEGWCRTGDLATQDAEGYLWYKGRADDVFKAAGYRIGPGEVENCLVKHPAVANAAVVPKPDPERGAVVKAFVVLAEGFSPSPALIDALQQHVRDQLAPYEYPKEIEFLDALPMTTTGKVQRRVLRLRERDKSEGRA